MPYKVINVILSRNGKIARRRSMVFRPDNQHEKNDAELEIEKWISEHLQQGYSQVSRTVDNFELRLRNERSTSTP